MLRFGTVPILWNNDDVPELTPPVPFERVLDEIRAARFEGTELGSNYPRDSWALRTALESRGLALSGAYYCPALTEPEAVAEALDGVGGFLDFLHAAGSSTLIVAQPVLSERAAVAGRVQAAGGPALTDAQWHTLADALNELGTRVAARGMALAFHNHAGTYVETPLELKRLMSLTDPRLVGLCLDTGHYAYGGGDPAEAIATWALRLRYVHLKDLDPRVKADCVAERAGFLEALKRRVFTELGNGCVDLRAVARKLQEIGYAGWVVAEQDTSYQAPLDAAKANRRALSLLFATEVTA